MGHPHPLKMFAVAKELQQRSNIPQAIRIIQEALSLTDRFAVGWDELGLMLSQIGRYAQSSHYFLMCSCTIYHH